MPCLGVLYLGYSVISGQSVLLLIACLSSEFLYLFLLLFCFVNVFRELK